MSNLFSTPKTPKVKEPEPVESVQQIQVDATETARKRRRSLTGRGRQSTMFAGIQSALATGLKRRLGE